MKAKPLTRRRVLATSSAAVTPTLAAPFVAGAGDVWGPASPAAQEDGGPIRWRKARRHLVRHRR